LLLFSKKKVSKSFKNNENRKGDIFSPCFTPTSLIKNTEHSSPFRIHVLIFSDLEQISKKCQDTIACYLKIFIILYADDTVILSVNRDG
jgi:hypothetical protein